MIANAFSRCSALLLAALLASSSGCQYFKPKERVYRPPTDPSQQSAGPLKPEQKLDVQMAIGRSLEKQGETEQAIQVYRGVAEKDARRADAPHRLAVLHDKKGQSDVAAKFYATALKKDPGNAELHCDFGYSCYLQRNWADAEKHLRRALDLNPEFARAHNNLGLLWARTGKVDQSLAEFSKAGCKPAAAHSNAAIVLTLEERWPDAQRQYELALAADPSSASAKAGLAALGARTAAAPAPAQPAVALTSAETPAGQTELSVVSPAGGDGVQ